ncbi:hypothetical protein [Mycobacterium alsense]|uniref:hypothetical protein n=1 Tax=Mycobacterium alsense TaxID=324058 RepID=UPI00104204CA|nr:hypothetical protein [Mycobacterium alsense]
MTDLFKRVSHAPPGHFRQNSLRVSASSATIQRMQPIVTTLAITAALLAPVAAPVAAPSALSGCYPETNGGNCYEPGEFCRRSDHGASGVAGDGENIVCQNNGGWRWEPVS